jgi:hypothetical protein
MTNSERLRKYSWEKQIAFASLYAQIAKISPTSVLGGIRNMHSSCKKRARNSLSIFHTVLTLLLNG